MNTIGSEGPPVTVSGLFLYPIKGCRGLSLSTAEVEGRGLRHDRRFMVVDREGRFLTQREHPALARVQVQVAPQGALVLSAEGIGEITVEPPPVATPARTVEVWGERCPGLAAGPAAAAFFHALLGIPCELVAQPESGGRPLDPRYAAQGEDVSFADAFPFLVVSEASLDDLNRRLAEPVGMDRFRPNIVIRGCGPYEEDVLGRGHIGSLPFRFAKRCARCVVVTTDQQTGAVGKEPLRTLSRYRREGNNVYFGQNAVAEGTGTLRLGDAVTLARSPGPAQH